MSLLAVLIYFADGNSLQWLVYEIAHIAVINLNINQTLNCV